MRLSRQAKKIIEKIRDLSKKGVRSFRLEAEIAKKLGSPGSDVYFYFPSMENRFKNLLREHGFLVDYIITIVDPESRCVKCKIISELKKCT